MGGKRIFATLKAQLKGVGPGEIEICQANELLSAHFSPKPLIFFERYKFWTTSEMEPETIRESSLRIQKMSEFCDFQEFLDQALRNQFIMGFRDVQNNIRALLLAETNLSFKRTVEVTQRIKSSYAEAKLIAPAKPGIFRMALHSKRKPNSFV
ncbi:hypothetical protein HZS_5465 [Henneguya salminicola]|nr:hypothetical protein HZS_5465 [Henneguya salminicola]